MKTLWLFLLFLYFVLFGYHYKPLVPLHDIPAGTVIQNSDLRTGECWTQRPEDYATERSWVVGHKALRPLRGGGDIHYSDVTD